MSAGVYRCRWLSLYRDSGAVLRALAFVANDTHPQYAGRLSRHRRVQAIARARGKWGACRDYLAGVVSMLQTLSAPDAELERLLRCVDQTAQD